MASWCFLSRRSLWMLSYGRVRSVCRCRNYHLPSSSFLSLPISSLNMLTSLCVYHILSIFKTRLISEPFIPYSSFLPDWARLPSLLLSHPTLSYVHPIDLAYVAPVPPKRRLRRSGSLRGFTIFTNTPFHLQRDRRDHLLTQRSCC